MHRHLYNGCLAVLGVALPSTLSACGSDSSGSSTASTSIDGVQTYGNLSRNHTTEDVDYPQTPPVGGDHDPQWLDCTGTVYDQPVRDENAVHSLEHGAVWITYNGDATDADVTSLASRVQGQPYTLMSPYPDEPGTIELTAWGLQLTVDSADDPRIDKFLQEYRQGPQTPEPGATCEAGDTS
jgi:hypothetical protein